MNRRGFFTRGAHLAAASALAFRTRAAWAQGKVARTGGVKLKLGLNAYSFNRPLSAGEMTLEDLVVYCAQNGFDALDATGYYFPGYPKVPDDDTIRSLKMKAYLNGVTLSSTGVRNDFSLPDAAQPQTGGPTGQGLDRSRRQVGRAGDSRLLRGQSAGGPHF